MSTLYLVATPIGNLEDISARALKVLRQVPLIAAEDTRHSRRLLDHYDISTPLTSYHEHNEAAKTPELVKALEAGDLALISDAGTPALNDPGYRLVVAASQAGHQVSPIPGPSAPIAALVASGLPTDRFLYLGYLPRKPRERQRSLAAVAKLPFTLVILETPHRLPAALDDLLAVLGDRPLAVARELTKVHEEIFRGLVSEAQAHLQTQPPRGEITLVVAGQPEQEAEAWPEARVLAALVRERERGLPASQIARQVARDSGWSRRSVYQLLTRLADET